MAARSSIDSCFATYYKPSTAEPPDNLRGVTVTKSSGFLKEFKAFAVRGNMVDLAVGVIIGAAFSKIVDSLVKD